MTQAPSSFPSPERERFLVEARSVLSERADVAAAYLYGSAARGRTTPLSDIDLAILPVEGLSESARAMLQRHLVNRLGAIGGSESVSVDVRFFDELPLAIRGRILREGVLVIDRDLVLRVRAEVRSRMEYHDFQQFERAGTEQWVRAVRERRKVTEGG